MKLRDILKVTKINPWFMGKTSKGSSVPLYSLLQFLSPYFGSYLALDRYQSICNIISSEKVKNPELDIRSFEYFPNYTIKEFPEKKIIAVMTAFQAVFNVENRVFPSMNFSSIFPHLGVLIKDNPSGKGMGKKVFSLLMQYWDSKDLKIKENAFLDLKRLFFPPVDSIQDPITNFVFAVSGRDLCNPPTDFNATNVDLDQDMIEMPVLSEIDKNLSEFITRLINKSNKKSRTSAVKDLSYGIHLSICLHLLHHPFKNKKTSEVHGVLAYGSIPPGQLSNPYMDTIITSLSYSIEEGYKKSLEDFKNELKEFSKNEKLHDLSALEIGKTYAENLGITDDDSWSSVEKKFPELSNPLGTDSDYDLLVDAIFHEIEFSPSSIKGNFITLAKDIGFCGPQKATSKSGDSGQKPRLILDLPILNVLVNGLIDEPTGFDDFVAMMSNKLGIIVGPPRNESQSFQLVNSLPKTYNIEDLEVLLIQNKEELKKRLLRCGLAKTFSDSTTIIYPINSGSENS